MQKADEQLVQQAQDAMWQPVYSPPHQGGGSVERYPSKRRDQNATPTYSRT